MAVITPSKCRGAVFEFLKLWCSDAANAVAYEIECVDSGALGVAFYVGGAETEKDSHYVGYAGCLTF